MEMDVSSPQELLISYEKLPNGDVYIGNLLITNTCADGSLLSDAINWIILERNGNLYLDSRYETSEFQREGCLYKKVNCAEGIAAFIQKNHHKIKKVQVKMQVYESVIKVTD